MKKLFSLILIFLVLFQCNAFSAELYTDFAGTEFSDNYSVPSGTSLKIEIYNNDMESLSGRLLYSFYSDNKLVGAEIGTDVELTENDKSLSITYRTKKSYGNVEFIKIMLWTNDGKLVPVTHSLKAKKGTGPDGPSSQYRNFGEQPDDKLKEQMPVPFDINNYNMTEVTSYNFDDFDFSLYNEKGGNLCGDFKQSHSTGLWSIVDAGGVNDSPCVKLENTEDVKTTRFQMVFNDYNAKAGDWYCIKFKVRGEGLTNDGSVQPYVDFADDTSKTVSSAYGEDIDAEKANAGWTDCSLVEMIAMKPNDIGEESEFYGIYVNAFMSDMPQGSSAYIDDIVLYKIYFEPMETVLVSPNYKGLIYGEGGKNDINLKVYLNTYNGSYNLDDYKLVSRIVDAEDNIYTSAEAQKLDSVMEVSFSSAILEMGKDYYLQSILYDGQKEIQKQEWTLRKREESYRPHIYIDENNRYIKDGVPALPIFQYAHGNNYEEHVEVMTDTAYDAYTVAGAYHTQYRTPRMQRLRNAMKQNGVGGLLECCGYVYSHLYTGLPQTNVKKQSDIRSLLTVMLNNFKTDPLIWGYRVYDEQNAVHYGEELRWQNDIMAAVDIDHPTFGVTDKTLSGRPGIYSKTADVIGVDPYFCTGKENQDLSKVGKMIREFSNLNPGRPVFATLQAFWFKSRGDLRGPTQQEYRNMVWQAVCEDVCAIDNYAYADLKASPWSDLSYEEIWQQQLDVLEEVKVFEDVILSVQPSPYYSLKNGEDAINIKTARHNGKSYIFAVNVENEVNNLSIKLDGVNSAKEYYFGNTVLADGSGYLNIAMEPYGVVILEAEQNDYLSSHAKLDRFSVSDGEKSYFLNVTDEDNSVIYIDKDTSELDYFIKASDNAKLYINGSIVPEKGRISIDATKEIAVKVVSEDDRFSDEKIYTVEYNRKPVYKESFDKDFSVNSIQNSEVFEDTKRDGTAKVVADSCDSDSKALQFAKNGSLNAGYLTTRYFTKYNMTPEDEILFSVKMKLNDPSSDGVKYMQADLDVSTYQCWSLFGETDGKYYIRDWSDTGKTYGALTPGKWYELSIRISGNFAYTSIIDTNTGNGVIDPQYACVTSSAASTALKRLVFRFTNLSSNGITLDDASLSCY